MSSSRYSSWRACDRELWQNYIDESSGKNESLETYSSNVVKYNEDRRGKSKRREDVRWKSKQVNGVLRVCRPFSCNKDQTRSDREGLGKRFDPPKPGVLPNPTGQIMRLKSVGDICMSTRRTWK